MADIINEPFGFTDIKFNDFKLSNPSIIKVVGVGGGGGNAVNHMYREGIHDVSFVICNTDNQALMDSPIPTRLQLGVDGLGAGNRPERAEAAALASIDSINEMLNDGTRMVFITAGMGGGTGTGAAPVVAKCAKEMGILTVGIVTIPFGFEGEKKIIQALNGVENISKHVDALLVINNERLREIYPELTLKNAFAKADDTLSIAARSIAEIITVHGIVNLDFQDVTTVLKDGGVAIMSTGYGEGENRVRQAIENALCSPLLNNNSVYSSKKVLLNIIYSDQENGDELTMEEMNDVHDFMSKFGNNVETKFGIAIDSSLGKKVKITILATGFGLEDAIDTTLLDDEERQRVRDKISIFYGQKGKRGIIKQPLNIYLFSDAALSNDEVTEMVENTPTYKRTTPHLDEIKKKAAAIEDLFTVQ